MNINYVTINELTEIDKLRFIKFIYDNTNSFILNTFGHTWSGRDWWSKYPIEACTDDKGKVLGLHAYTVNDKYEDTLKTYYIVCPFDHEDHSIVLLF